MRVTPSQLIALGPIPRRIAPSTDDLLQLIEDLKEGLLGASGIFEIPVEFELDAAA